MSIEFEPMKEINNKEWDVFISHASEDKEDFVRPLAEKLQKCGVKVWYDEFELKMGDSLSDSINRGLQESKYGIIVFSQAFFEKEWAKYELKSLLMRQMNRERAILPIWHNINKDFIREKSLYLLDIKALSSEMGWDELVDNILEIVRPDIIDSHLMLKMGVELHKRVKELPIVEISASKLHNSPIRHKTLPVHLIIASRLISEVFWDVLPMDYVDMVTDFARDLDYDKEFIIWSAMANSYVAFIRETQCGVNDVSKKREAISLLLMYSHKGQLEEVSCLENINESEYYYLIKLFIDNYDYIISMVKKYS
jgi:hypothetical protein